MIRGMTTAVLRHANIEASLGGVSTGVNMLTVVGVLHSHDQIIVDPLPPGMQITLPTPSAPPVALEVRRLSPYTEQAQIVAVPLMNEAKRWARKRWVRDDRAFMAGGAFLASTDGRMNDLLRDLSGYAYEPLIAIHDRFEG